MTAPGMALQISPQAIQWDEDTEQAESIRLRDSALQALYGNQFPFLSTTGIDQASPEAFESFFVAWVENLWANREAQMIYPLWVAQRNREFYKGNQFIDSEGVGRRWVTPRAPSDAVRLPINVTKAALNLRSQIVSEQRPGFKIEPTNRDSQSKKKAEAKQLALNYAWRECDMESITSEVARWCGTDGCAFVETYWDDRAGPWHEFLTGQNMQLGDVRKRVLRMDEVRVSPNATATQKPDWMVVCRIAPTQDAVNRWGDTVADQASEDGQIQIHGNTQFTTYVDAGRQDDRFYDTPALLEYTAYCEPGDYFPNGLEVHVVGKKLTYVGKLLFGRVPVARYTDGSKDPAYFPEPEMNNWLDDQVSINVINCKIIEVIRKSAGGSYLSRPQAITSETKMFGGLSLVEVQGTGALGEIVQYLPPATVGADAVNFLTFHLQQFEQKSGWNDATRGSFKADQSGRAILAVREQVERTFMPLVSAFAKGACDDAKNTLAAMCWGYELPREIAITGSSRIDLARLITAEDLDGVSDVQVNPETLMPMPRSLRLFMLQSYLQQGLIPPDQFLRLQPFGWLEDVGNGDEDDRARANRIADLIRRGTPEEQLPRVLRMDNAMVHMDVYRRELLLNDDLPNDVRAVAYDRYVAYEQMQMAAMVAQTPPISQKKPGKPDDLPASQSPLLSSRPPVPAGPLSLDPSEEGSAGPMADALSPGM